MLPVKDLTICNSAKVGGGEGRIPAVLDSADSAGEGGLIGAG
jgi:hypothetical protein